MLKKERKKVKDANAVNKRIVATQREHEKKVNKIAADKAAWRNSKEKRDLENAKNHKDEGKIVRAIFKAEEDTSRSKEQLSVKQWQDAWELVISLIDQKYVPAGEKRPRTLRIIEGSIAYMKEKLGPGGMGGHLYPGKRFLEDARIKCAKVLGVTLGSPGIERRSSLRRGKRNGRGTGPSKPPHRRVALPPNPRISSSQARTGTRSSRDVNPSTETPRSTSQAGRTSSQIER